MTPLSSKTSTKGRTLYCRKCDGHGKLSILKAHNTKCPYLFCECKNCQKLDKKRRNSFQKRNHRQIEAAEKLTKLRQHILQLRADLKDDPDAEVLIAEFQNQRIDLPLHCNVNGKTPGNKKFYQRRRCRSCDITKRVNMVNGNESKLNNDNFTVGNQLAINRATSSSPYQSSTRSYSTDLNSTASSPSSKNSSTVAPFDLWLEKEYQRRQHKKNMEAMRTYTVTAQITTSSSSTVTSTPTSATNSVVTNPLLSHALNTAGISKHNNFATTSASLESLTNRKRSAENEIIQIDDDQPTPRRHCSNNTVKSPVVFQKPLTPPITTSTVTTPSTTPSKLTSKPQSIPLETTAPPAMVEGHHYVTLPTIPPISILVPNDIKIMDKFDDFVKPNSTNFNPSTQQLTGQPALQEISTGLIHTPKPISTSVPNQLLLEGLRQQKPQDSQSFSSAFLSHSMGKSQLNPSSTNSTVHPMLQQNLNMNLNGNNINFNANSNLNSSQALNIVPQPQWMQLMQQPQPQYSQKQNLFPQQQIQGTPQIFPPTMSPFQKNQLLQNQPFPPTITNQPQLRFSTPPLPPPSTAAGLSTLLSQNSSSNIAKIGSANQSNSTTPALSTSSTGILTQPQQKSIESDSNVSCNNLINFAQYALPTFTPHQHPFILQAQFQQQKQQHFQDATVPQEQKSKQQIATEQENIQQQNITSLNLLKHIQEQQKLAIVTSSANQQIQLPSIPLSQTPSSTQSHSPALSSSSLAKLNFSLEHQPFAQYLLNLPSISPSGSSLAITTPQLPSIGQSPADTSSENVNENSTTPAFIPKISEQIFVPKILTQFDASNLKPTDGIVSSFIDGNDSSIGNMTIGSTVDPTYLNSLQSTMILLSSTGGQQLVK